MHLIVFAISVLSLAVLTRWIRDFAMARGWVSPPTSTRHLHTRPLPRFGGMAIILTLWEMVLLAYWLPTHFSLPGMMSSQMAIRILAPATVIFLLGLWDDIRGLNAYTKFGVQVLAAVPFFFNCFGFYLVSFKTPRMHSRWSPLLPLS